LVTAYAGTVRHSDHPNEVVTCTSIQVEIYGRKHPQKASNGFNCSPSQPENDIDDTVRQYNRHYNVLATSALRYRDQNCIQKERELVPAKYSTAAANDDQKIQPHSRLSFNINELDTHMDTHHALVVVRVQGEQ